MTKEQIAKTERFNSHSAARAVAIGVFIVLCFGAWSCPMCKDAVTSESASGTAGATIGTRARGYYYSIVGMVSMPFLVIGGVTWALMRERRTGTA
ncbi:MAG: hypothetical protein ACR2IE_01985 [Candidatus Sumerlaeaceae bacterium]